MTINDVFLYSWASVLAVAFTIAFPPFALVWMLFPRWHRKRLRARADVRAARFERWAVRL